MKELGFIVVVLCTILLTAYTIHLDRQVKRLEQDAVSTEEIDEHYTKGMNSIMFVLLTISGAASIVLSFILMF